MRWKNILVVNTEKFGDFWFSKHTVEKEILFIFGMGFDPRTSFALSKFAEAEMNSKVLPIKIDEGKSSSSKKLQELVDKNKAKIEAILDEKLEPKTVKLIDADGTRIRGTKVTRVVRKEISHLVSRGDFSDIVLDISALPRSIYLEILDYLIEIIDQNKFEVNLHVIITENPQIDAKITKDSLDEDMYYLSGYKRINLLSLESNIKIWLPLLGEHKNEQLTKIAHLFKPHETRPIIPFPSKNPRRGDNLLLEYHELLFEELQIDPRQIIYASESNPLNVYEQLISTVKSYDESMNDVLNGCSYNISPLSSKLMTIGAFLAGNDLKRDGINIGISMVAALGYKIDEELDAEKINIQNKDNRLHEMWLIRKGT